MIFNSLYTLIFDIGIKTALHTSINTCSFLLNNLTNYSTNYPHIKKWLDETDIKWTIEIMEHFIIDLNKKDKDKKKDNEKDNKNENENENENEKEILVIDKCLEGLQEILDKLEIELKEIENGIKYHESKYLYTWRNIYIDEYIIKANNHIKILNNRFELFIKIINSHKI